MRLSLSKYRDEKFTIPFNKQAFDKYIEYLSDNIDSLNLQQRTLEDYVARTIDFIKFLDAPLTVRNEEKVDAFINSTDISNSTKTRRLNALKKLSTFLINEYNIDYLDSVSVRKDESEIRKKADPLSMEQIIKLRNELRNSKKHKQLLAFEMAYSYGCTLDELVEHCHENYDSKRHCFTLSKRDVHIHSDMAILIEKDLNILRKLGLSSYQVFFSKMAIVLNRDVSWNDINQSHKNNSSTCPICGNRYINESEYWALAQDENDIAKTKWFICTKVCGDESGAK